MRQIALVIRLDCSTCSLLIAPKGRNQLLPPSVWDLKAIAFKGTKTTAFQEPRTKSAGSVHDWGQNITYPIPVVCGF